MYTFRFHLERIPDIYKFRASVGDGHSPFTVVKVKALIAREGPRSRGNPIQLAWDK
jgi:hypothetical protein